MDIQVKKKLILRSGKYYDLGTVECEAEWRCQELWYQKEGYFLGDYAAKHLERIIQDVNDEPDDDDDYCGKFKLPLENVQDIIKRCNEALVYEYAKNKKPLEKIFPIGSCMKYHYKEQYGKAFFDDIRYILRTLPVVLEDLGNTDVEFWLVID